jgi:hypothetical protein
MVKSPRFLLTLSLLSFTSAVAFGSPAKPSWWKRQITFSSHSDRASWDLSVGTPEEWFNFIVLVVALVLFFYFVVMGAGRVYRERREKASQARKDP